jgi:hypothetical protein
MSPFLDLALSTFHFLIYFKNSSAQSLESSILRSTSLEERHRGRKCHNQQHCCNYHHTEINNVPKQREKLSLTRRTREDLCVLKSSNLRKRFTYHTSDQNLKYTKGRKHPTTQ